MKSLSTYAFNFLIRLSREAHTFGAMYQKTLKPASQANSAMRKLKPG